MAKKNMFSDKFGLTEAVLSGRKTQTRRIITCSKTFKGQDVCGFNVYSRQSDGAILEYPRMYDMHTREFDDGYIMPKYKVGEVVAVAQRYSDIYNDECDPRLFPKGAGWTNKMFVRADLMPYHIRITNVRVERLQDISDEDCIKEGVGISRTDNRIGRPFSVPFNYFIGKDEKGSRYSTAREAYAALIDKISGKGTWESNPWIFVYDFELMK